MVALPVSGASYSVDMSGGEWLTPESWKRAWNYTSDPDDIAPTTADLAIVHQDRILFHSSGNAFAREFYISFHTADHTRDFTGIFNISNSASLDITNSMWLSRAGADAEMNIYGDETTISANRFNIGWYGETPESDDLSLRFYLGASGAGTFNVGTLDINGDNGTAGNQNTNLIIDSSSYIGGAGIIDLITYMTLEDSAWDNVIIQNLDGYNAVVDFDSDSMFLRLTPIPEPSTSILGSLACLCLLTVRRRT